VELSGAPLPLTRIEFDLFERLVLSGGRVVTYRELAESVLQGQFTSESATLRVHVSHLRRKLGAARTSVVTVRGRGLVFDPAVLGWSLPSAMEMGAASRRLHGREKNAQPPPPLTE
jgi:DNA-binding response OmpR family regulator